MRRVAARFVLALLLAVVAAGGSVAAAGDVPTTWSAPVSLVRGNGIAGDAQVLIDAGGTATAVFVFAPGLGSDIYAATAPPGGSWSAPTQLSRPDQFSYAPRIAMGPTGDVFATWQAFDGDTWVVQTSILRKGGSWSPPEDHTVALPQLSETRPAIAVNSLGTALLAWINGAPPENVHVGNVEVSVLEPGGPWSAPTQIAGPNDEPDGVQAALDDSGRGIVTWWTETPAGSAVRAALGAADGTWAPASTISADTFNGLPRLAANGTGDAVVVFEHSPDSGVFGVSAVSRSGGGAWQAPVDLTAPGTAGDSPDVAIDAHGDATAVWIGGDGTGVLIRSSTLHGGTWGAPVDVSGPTPGDHGRPRVASNPSGDVAVVFTVPTPGQPEFITMVAVKAVGGPWSAPVALSGLQERTMDPAVALNYAGQAVAAWYIDRGDPINRDNGIDAVTSPAPVAPPAAPPVVVVPAFTG